MHVIFYKTSSDRRKLNKALTVILDSSNIYLKDSPSSITDPFMKISKFEHYDEINYMYIEEFGRYYFVDDIRPLFGKELEITGHVDVLMSNKNAILGLNAIVNRSSNVSNPYLVDGDLTMTNTRTQKILNFPANNKFDSNLTYVLTVAGGTGV